MTLPNFLIIGAMKAGTTSLYVDLARHPQVFLPSLKEPCFFRWGQWEEPPAHMAHLPRTRAAYEALFDGAGGARAVGEASPHYLHHSPCAERIHALVPEARLIAVLRHPVDRAFSHFNHNVAEGREPDGDFARAVREEMTRTASGDRGMFAYLSFGEYAPRIAAYLSLFPRDRMLFLRFDDLAADPGGTLARVCAFLAIDPLAVRPERAHNEARVPRNALVAKVKQSTGPLRDALRPLVPVPLLRRAWRWAHPRRELEPALRAELTERLRPDILRTQELTGLDLSPWLGGA